MYYAVAEWLECMSVVVGFVVWFGLNLQQKDGMMTYSHERNLDRDISTVKS